MLRGFYTAASGMLAQQRLTDMLTNNLANANTPGFKQDQSSIRDFPQLLLQRMDQQSLPVKDAPSLPSFTQVGSLSTGVYLQETQPKFLQGDLQNTGKKTDLAIVDQGTNSSADSFFTIQGEDGHVRYTRNGNFTLDQNGYLTQDNGLYVLDSNGNKIQLKSDQFTVDNNGNISENGNRVATLGIAYTNKPMSLIKEGDGLYGTVNNAKLPASQNTQFTLNQGFLEASNVDQTQVMTQMLAAYRSFEANQKVLQAYDQSMDKAVNEVGRVNG
ncbi:flagellar hook-basal body protein [Heyndrickxia acidicola]|uniref:Flagellar hook-basal body protein n=1 Tax=Heyndrickxia acidicola TaxID=209389 RepID=A0ABU6MER9_9BACI|nr:flagellar hook-basal body protein [Heyndrickxia acidicola]MED1202938.1 flagellar hook-basal body protein [Heyndrickxia acidicola]